MMSNYTQPQNGQPQGGHPHGEQLSAYIDGMLDVTKTRSIAGHLRACSQCRTMAEQLEQTRSLLHALDVPPRPGPEFWTDAYRRLRVADQQHAAVRRTLWDILREPGHASQRRWAAGLAAVAAVGALVAGPLTVSHPPVSPVTQVVTVAPDVTPDVSALVESHTNSVSRLPLADSDRQKMIAADAQQTPDAPEAAAYADGPF